ncbi:aminopeptidase-like protein [Leptodontidium sp. 2 PMI_412]|nr:aminopeptidase-like protein [Leptodontidium sp. 2 PMI_412]
MAATDLQERAILPVEVKPIDYDLSLFDMDFYRALSYSGLVKITLDILEATSRIVLNSSNLNVAAAHVLLGDRTIPAIAIVCNEEQQQLRLSFENEIPIANSVLLSIHFQGFIKDSLSGFYQSKYRPASEPSPATPSDGHGYLMFSTHFESSHARTAFPCFDEPSLKATFGLTLEIPESLVGLSNMPVEEIQSVPGSPGCKIVKFERTPRMSTYLLTWAIGDFEYVEDFTVRAYQGQRIAARVYTTRGLATQAHFALEHVGPYIDYFSKLFGIDYPLPKLDLLAVHEFARGAMEGWGLATFRLAALLFDEKTSDPMNKTRIAYTIAHEISHQWFGNLVTMAWWDDLWLNEGFATWIGRVAVDHLHPKYDIWSLFSCDGLQLALGLDSLSSSHPIKTKVGHPLDVDQVFDAISYIKGASILRMLAGHIGQDKMLNGVSSYLKQHSFGNSTIENLWDHISHSYGQDVSVMMRNWTEQMGYPVVKVDEADGQVNVHQSRYIANRKNETSMSGESMWWIPLGFHGTATKAEFSSPQASIQTPNVAIIKLNSDNLGFFRTQYSPHLQQNICTHLRQLSAPDKIGLIADAAALAFSGHSKTSDLLSFLQNFQEESNHFVWRQVRESLTRMSSIFADDDTIIAGLNAFTLELLAFQLKTISFQTGFSTDFSVIQRNAILYEIAGLNGEARITNEAKRLFKAYISADDNIIISPSLLGPVLSIAIRNGDDIAYNGLKSKWKTAVLSSEKEIILRALCHVQQEEILPDLFNFVLTQVPAQDILIAATELGQNREVRGLFWELVKVNFDAVTTALKGNPTLIERCLRATLEGFSRRDIVTDMEGFFMNKNIQAYDRMLENVKEAIFALAGYREREEESVRGWFLQHRAQNK